MVNPSVPMENVNTMLFGVAAVTAVNAVIRTVIPLAREHEQTLCKCKGKDLIRFIEIHALWDTELHTHAEKLKSDLHNTIMSSMYTSE